MRKNDGKDYMVVPYQSYVQEISLIKHFLISINK